MENQLTLISSQFLWIYPNQEQSLWQLSGNQAKKETPKFEYRNNISKRTTTIFCNIVNWQSVLHLQ